MGADTRTEQAAPKKLDKIPTTYISRSHGYIDNVAAGRRGKMWTCYTLRDNKPVFESDLGGYISVDDFCKLREECLELKTKGKLATETLKTLFQKYTNRRFDAEGGVIVILLEDKLDFWCSHPIPFESMRFPRKDDESYTPRADDTKVSHSKMGKRK